MSVKSMQNKEIKKDILINIIAETPFIHLMPFSCYDSFEYV